MLTEICLVLTAALTPYVPPYWELLCRHTRAYPMFVVGCFASQLAGYFLGCAPFVLLDALRARAPPFRKIQAGKYAPRRAVLAASAAMLRSFATVVLPLLAGGGLFIERAGISRDAPFPSARVVLLQVAYFFLVEDFLNYWVHRALHLPWLYTRVHSVHHAYDAPFAVVAAYAHPAEVVLQALPTFAGPLMLGPHLYTLCVWQLFRNWEAIDIHSGYDHPWGLASVVPWYAGAEHHDFHHFLHSGNFASVFTWCDWAYGTDLAYDSFRRKGRGVKPKLT